MLWNPLLPRTPSAGARPIFQGPLATLAVELEKSGDLIRRTTIPKMGFCYQLLITAAGFDTMLKCELVSAAGFYTFAE